MLLSQSLQKPSVPTIDLELSQSILIVVRRVILCERDQHIKQIRLMFVLYHDQVVMSTRGYEAAVDCSYSKWDTNSSTDYLTFCHHMGTVTKSGAKASTFHMCVGISRLTRQLRYIWTYGVSKSGCLICRQASPSVYFVAGYPIVPGLVNMCKPVNVLIRSKAQVKNQQVIPPTGGEQTALSEMHHLQY